MENVNIAWTFDGRSINMVVGRTPYTVPKTHPNFEKILQFFRDGETDTDRLEDLVDVRRAISNVTDGKVEVLNGVVYYDGEVLHNYAADRILAFLQEGLPASPIMRFVEKVMKNPSKRAVDELYKFLEKAEMPLTKNGNFLAYKWVNNDYFDCHSNSFDNSVGKTVEMPRNQVDDNPNHTCSSGLHVCSKNYVNFGQRLMLVEVNPKNVVAVPIDYNASKMRVSKYKVLEEILDTDGWKEHKFDRPIWG